MATLIYSSVIYHRHRRTKAHRHRHSISRLDHERYDRFYNGAYSEDGIVEANYQNSRSLFSQHNTGSPTISGESPTGPVESGGAEVRQIEFSSFFRRVVGNGRSLTTKRRMKLGDCTLCLVLDFAR